MLANFTVPPMRRPKFASGSLRVIAGPSVPMQQPTTGKNSKPLPKRNCFFCAGGHYRTVATVALTLFSVPYVLAVIHKVNRVNRHALQNAGEPLVVS